MQIHTDIQQFTILKYNLTFSGFFD